MLTRAMAIDLAPHGIRVNAVGPGTVPIPGENARTEELLAAKKATGLEVGSIQDVTPSPHNGCRPPKRRRV